MCGGREIGIKMKCLPTRFYFLALIPLFIIGASECKAETSFHKLPYVEVPLPYNQCTEKALQHPFRMPPVIKDKSFHAICDNKKEVIVICFEQVMNVTKTDRSCSMKKAWEDYEFGMTHGIIER